MNSSKNKILTLPNILSFARIGLIGVMVWLYTVKNNGIATALVLVISGLTDLADGYIARHFNMISDFGKILDPIADKLTLGVMLLCLLHKHSIMLLPLSLIVVKEISAGIMGLIAVKRSGRVLNSVWHGKITTLALYINLGVHLVFVNIPFAVSLCFAIATSILLVLSAILYAIRNIKEMGLKNKNAQP